MIKVMRINENAKIPTRAYLNDAGGDLYSIENITIPPLSRVVVGTGIIIELPATNTYARICPRSGLAVKNGIDVLAGVIDYNYRGEIKVVLFNTDKENSFEVKIGDRIAQLIVQQFVPFHFFEHNIDTETDRAAQGFGSSGA